MNRPGPNSAAVGHWLPGAEIPRSLDCIGFVRSFGRNWTCQAPSLRVSPMKRACGGSGGRESDIHKRRCRNRSVEESKRRNYPANPSGKASVRSFPHQWPATLLKEVCAGSGAQASTTRGRHSFPFVSNPFPCQPLPGRDWPNHPIESARHFRPATKILLSKVNVRSHRSRDHY